MNQSKTSEAAPNAEAISVSGAEAAELDALRARVANPTTATAEEVLALHVAENGKPGFLEKPFLGFKSVTNGDAAAVVVGAAVLGALTYGAYRLFSKDSEMADTAFGGETFVL